MIRIRCVTRGLAGAVIWFGAIAPAAWPAEAPHPLMTLDERGPDLPPVGRSLFDFLVAAREDGRWVLRVPYPFEALADLIDAQLRPGYRAAFKQTLYPLGRSLHRHAAAPDYFKFPRAVGAVDTEPDPDPGTSGLMLKDRLYIGYQPVTESIEVISYNEGAGRFEYQVVSDYRDGGAPEVRYADRGVCTACHHNQALIFAVQPWDESNSNIKVAALLKAEADSFYGAPAQVGFEIPESIDKSTDRANLFAAHQFAWRVGCAESIACRRDGLITVLRYRLSGGYQRTDAGDGARDRFAAAIMDAWRAMPGGLAIPSADIADHDPFKEAGFGTGRTGMNASMRQLVAMVSPDLLVFDDALEPLYERKASEVWRVPSPLAGMPRVAPHWINTVIDGLGGFLANADIEALDERLFALALDRPGGRRLDVPCTVTTRGGTREELRAIFHCDRTAGLTLNGRLRGEADGGASGLIDRLRAGASGPGGLAVEDATLSRTEAGWTARFRLRDVVTGLNLRIAGGNAVRAITLRWPSGPTDAPVAATATLDVATDFQVLEAAVDAIATETRARRSDALADAPFRRVALLRPLFDRLGMAPRTWCCLDGDRLPPPRLVSE
jgi:hypothetical protein